MRKKSTKAAKVFIFFQYNPKLFFLLCFFYISNAHSQSFISDTSSVFIQKGTITSLSTELNSATIYITQGTMVSGKENINHAKIVYKSIAKRNKTFSQVSNISIKKNTGVIVKNKQVVFQKFNFEKQSNNNGSFVSSKYFPVASSSSNQEYKIVFAIISITKKYKLFYYLKDKEFSFFTQAKLIATLGVRSIRPPPSFY